MDAGRRGAITMVFDLIEFANGLNMRILQINSVCDRGSSGRTAREVADSGRGGGITLE